MLQASAGLTKCREFETLADMPKKRAKGSEKGRKSEIIVTEDVIMITLPPADAKRAQARIRKSGVAKFKIKEIKVKSIPSIQRGNKPVQCP